MIYSPATIYKYYVILYYIINKQIFNMKKILKIATCICAVALLIGIIVVICTKEEWTPVVFGSLSGLFLLTAVIKKWNENKLVNSLMLFTALLLLSLSAAWTGENLNVSESMLMFFYITSAIIAGCGIITAVFGTILAIRRKNKSSF